MSPRTEEHRDTSRARLTVVSARFDIPYLQDQLVQVFDRPFDGGFYRDPSGQTRLYMRELADVRLDFWWTGQPGDSRVFGEDDWEGYLTHVGDYYEEPHGLFLTDRPIDAALQDRFGIRPSVIAIRRRRVACVAISYADDPSIAGGVRRVHTATEWMVG